MQLYYFSASWCMPCKNYGPIVERVCEQAGVELIKCDVSSDEGGYLADLEGVRGVPCVVIYYDKEKVGMQQGALTENGLKALIGSVAG